MIRYKDSNGVPKYHVTCDQEGYTLVYLCDNLTGHPIELDGRFDNLLDARNYVEYQKLKQFKKVYN